MQRKIKESISNLLRDAKLRREQIDHIILEGGSTQLPFVTDLINDCFQLRADANGMGISKILTWPDPTELAAYGAMLYAAEKNDLYRGSATEDPIVEAVQAEE